METPLYTMGTREQAALRSLLKGTPVKRASQWLLSVHIRSEKGEGWPHLTSQDMPTVWGGTLDGLRGVVLGGESLHHPTVQQSLHWLFTKQRDDGAFGSREISYSSVEATAWVIIALKQIGYDIDNSESIQKALTFLETSMSPSGELGTSPEDEPRIYPSVLTLWALYGFSEKTTLVARFLKDTRDSTTGGWGIKPGAQPNPLSTCHALNVLLLSKHLDRDDVITRQAVDFILSHQNDIGSWDNFTETWYSVHQPNIPIRCDEYVTTWAITALLRAGLSILSPPILKGITWLIHEQKDDGYWLYDPLNDSKHIWCVADCIDCLATAKEQLLAHITNGGTGLWNLPLQTTQRSMGDMVWDRIRQMASFLQENFVNVLIVLMALYVFRNQFNSFIDAVTNFLKLQSGDLLTAIVSNILWAILLVVGTYSLNKLRR